MERIARKCFVIVMLFFISFLISSFPVKALFASTPVGISTTNVQNNRFTVSWVTETDETCQVNYGTSAYSLGKRAYDDRGQAASGKTHHVTITGLSANTQYYYEVISGGQAYRNNGRPYTISTGISLTPASVSHVAYGQVSLSSGGPANGAMVFLKVQDNDGAGTPGTSQTLSALTDNAGWWSMELNSVRTQNLTNYFIFSESGDSEIISARADELAPTAIVIDTARDHPAQTIALAWILNLTLTPWYQNEKSYYTGPAACQMILNYIRQGAGVPDLTQNQIYNYIYPYSQTCDFNVNDVDTVLGHFDPYRAYNFNIGAYNASDPDAINNYMRDICHRMAFTVTREDWRKKEALVARPNTPAAVPIFADAQGYNHWVAVKGAAASNNPNPDPLLRPWDAPDFTIYGLWIKDPLVSGIGGNKYVTADECRKTYFKPLKTSDSYNGVYIQVSELPSEESKSFAAIASPIPDSRKNLDWKNVIDPFILSDDEAAGAFEDTYPGAPILVRRMDTKDGDYCIIPYYKKAAPKIAQYTQSYRYLTAGVIIVDAKNGYFKEASWTEKPADYIIMSREDAVGLARKSLKVQSNNGDIAASLVWQAGDISSTPYKPFWKVAIGKSACYVSQEGKVYPIC